MNYPTRNPKLDAKFRYYYHLTESKHWGDNVILHPQDSGCNRGYNEPIISRTCVAPSLFHCLCAIPLRYCRDYKLYRTKTPIRAYYPFGVYDMIYTQEKWILEPCEFVFVEVFNLPITFTEDYPCSEYKVNTEIYREKYLKLKKAVKELWPEYWIGE